MQEPGACPINRTATAAASSGRGGVPECSAAVAAPARLRYQSLGSGQPSASSVTNEYPGGIPSTGTSEACGQHLEHCGALVELVEHRAVEHRRSRPQRVIHLPPVEAAALARYLVANRIRLAQGTVGVGEGIAGKQHRHIVHAERARDRQIGHPDGAGVRIRRGIARETADRPGAQHAEPGPDLLPFGVGRGIERPRPPIGRHAAHDCHAAVLRAGLVERFEQVQRIGWS